MNKIQRLIVVAALAAAMAVVVNSPVFADTYHLDTFTGSISPARPMSKRPSTPY